MNPMPPLRELVKRFKKQAEEAGFELQRAVIAPGDPDTFEVVMTVTEDMFKDPEQREIDKQFKEMERQLKRQTRDEKAQASDETRTNLEEWLDGS